MASVIIARSRAFTPSVDRFALALADQGHHVVVLRWNRDGRASSRFSERVKFMYFNLRAPYDQLHAALVQPFWQFYLFKVLIGADVDIMHACDLDTLLPALVASRVRGKKLLYTVYDFYADNLPIGVPSSLRNLVARLERLCISWVDWLFLVNEDQIRQVGLPAPKRISVVYNSPRDARERPRTSGQTPRNDGGRFLLYYAGNLHKSRGLGYAIEAVSTLPACEIELAGTGPDEIRLRKLAGSLGGHVSFDGLQPYESVIDHSLRADAVFAFYDPAIPSNRYASPNKLFEAMMCGKPFLTNAGTYAARLVTQEGCGLTIPYGDVESIRQSVIRLRNNPALCEELGTRGRRAYEERYSWAEMEQRIAKSYREVMR